jgi:sodium bile acid symporter family protein
MAFHAGWVAAYLDLLGYGRRSGLGAGCHGLRRSARAVQFDGISVPIAAGLLIMMHRVLAKVRCGRLDSVTGDRKLMLSSLLLNWVVGWALMFALLWLLPPDLPEYQTGLIVCTKNLAPTDREPSIVAAMRPIRRQTQRNQKPQSRAFARAF